MDFWHTCIVALNITCITLANDPTPIWRSEIMKWQPGEGSSFLQFYNLSLLNNLFWFLFSKGKEKKKISSVIPKPTCNTWTKSGQLTHSQGYYSQLWLLDSTLFLRRGLARSINGPFRGTMPTPLLSQLLSAMCMLSVWFMGSETRLPPIY